MKQENFNTFRVITFVSASCLVLGSMITGAAHALADKFHEINEQLHERDQKIRDLERMIDRQADANTEHRRNVATSIRDNRTAFDEEFHRIKDHIAEIEAKVKAETE